jgi:hypothetical protein
MTKMYPKLHNAMWPGLVGKGSGENQEPPIGLDEMLRLTSEAEVLGHKFTGVDLFLYHPHVDPDMNNDDVRRLADHISSFGLEVGSLVAPVWSDTEGGSSMGDRASQVRFLAAVRKACQIAQILDRHGIRKGGVIRVDSAEFGIAQWAKDQVESNKKIVSTFKEAAVIAHGFGQRIAAEGEICWAGMHSWKHMLDVLTSVNRPNDFGFQADLAHTYLYLMGYNALEHALLQDGYSADDFYKAYATMTNTLRPWTIDFHVAQNDGTTNASGNHELTGRHCMPDDPNGKLDIIQTSGYWLQGAKDRGLRHICWDGCMFDNAVLRDPNTWNSVLAKMISVRDAYGWNE